MLVEIGADGELSPMPPETPLAAASSYTTFRTYAGDRILRLDKHIERLDESARLQGLTGCGHAPGLRRALRALIPAAGFGETRLRITWAPPRLFAQAWPFEPLPPELYREGVACVTVPVRRASPHAKDSGFLPTAAAVYSNLPNGVHEGLMFDPADDALLEGLSSNFFAVKDGVLRTEGERVLAGVTRGTVLELASALLPVRLDAVRRSDVQHLSEAFITSVSRGVLPVVAIDGRSLGTGRPGAIAVELARRLEAVAQAEARPA